MSLCAFVLPLAVWMIVSAVRLEAQSQSTPDLRVATLEELMNIDEIRRSGLTSIPEILRLAPGVQVPPIWNASSSKETPCEP